MNLLYESLSDFLVLLLLRNNITPSRGVEVHSTIQRFILVEV
jgi:hypothetical protein